MTSLLDVSDGWSPAAQDSLLWLCKEGKLLPKQRLIRCSYYRHKYPADFLIRFILLTAANPAVFTYFRPSHPRCHVTPQNNGDWLSWQWQKGQRKSRLETRLEGWFQLLRVLNWISAKCRPQERLVTEAEIGDIDALPSQSLLSEVQRKKTRCSSVSH